MSFTNISLNYQSDKILNDATIISPVGIVKSDIPDLVNDLSNLSNNVSTNSANISTNTSNISINAANIATEIEDRRVAISGVLDRMLTIETTIEGVSTNSSQIAVNTSNIEINTGDIEDIGININQLYSITGTNTENIQNESQQRTSSYIQLDHKLTSYTDHNNPRILNSYECDGLTSRFSSDVKYGTQMLFLNGLLQREGGDYIYEPSTSTYRMTLTPTVGCLIDFYGVTGVEFVNVPLIL